MDDEYDLLRDAAALLDDLEPSFSIYFTEDQGACPPPPPLQQLQCSSPQGGAYANYSAGLPLEPLPLVGSYASSSDTDNPYEDVRRMATLPRQPETQSHSDATLWASKSPRGATNANTFEPPTGKQHPSASSNGKNPSRERLKAELAFLRDKVVELEKELGDLRFNHEQVATANATTTAIAPVWRRIAERQLERRRTTEAENERLKTVLDGQIRVAKSLEQMLRKRSSASMIDLYEGARGSRKRCRLDDNLDALYDHFMHEIEAAYHAVDDVFESNGLANTFDETVRGYAVKTRNYGGVEQVYVELMDIKIVPFDFDRASQAVWRMTRQEFTSQRRHSVETFQGTEDRFAVKFQAKSRSHDYVGLLDVTMVMRRFLEKDRMVLAWRATNSPSVDSKYEEWRNVYTEETGWIVVKRVPDDGKSASGAKTAVMQSCVHLIPRWYGNESPQRQHLPVKINTGDFAKLVMNSYEEDVIAITEAVENMLLDEVIAVRGRTSDDGRRSPTTDGRLC